MKKLTVVGLALVAALAMAAVAIAQYTIPAPVEVKLEGQVTPTKGGTKKKPKNGSVSMKFTVNKESNSTASQIVFFTPANIRLSGRGFRYCPATQINNEGVSSCPKGSRVGRGTAQALVGPRQTPFNFTITVFAASRNELALYLTGPLSIALSAPITKGGAPFGQKITIDIPERVQRPIGGLYANITEVSAKIGPAKGRVVVRKKVRGKRRKVRRTTFFAALTGCPRDRAHDMGVRLRFVPNPNPPAKDFAEARATDECRRRR